MRPTTTLALDLRRLFTTNVTDALITPPVETISEPTGDGIIEAPWAGATINQILLQIFGVGADNATCRGRVTGFNRSVEGNSTLWVPVPLYSFTATLGTALRVSGERWADTIVAITEYTQAKELMSGADNLQAGLKLDIFGCQKVKVQLDTNSSASSINALGKGF